MLKLGRLPARYTRATMQRAIVLALNFALLGPPPSNSDDWVAAVDAETGGDWGMMGNGDDLANPNITPVGDCTMADCAHQIMLRTANASSILIPGADVIVAIYNQLTGGQDTGLDELTVMNFMQSTGILGHKIDAHADIDPTNFNNLRWAIQLYGCFRSGIIVTDSMEDQFARGQPWEPVGGAQALGMHDIPFVKYVTDGGSTMYLAVSWAKLQPVTEAWMKWKLDDGSVVFEEAHLECAPDFIRATGVAPSAWDEDQLLREMGNLAA